LKGSSIDGKRNIDENVEEGVRLCSLSVGLQRLTSFTCCCRQSLHADDDDSVADQVSSITGWRSCHKCCVLQQSKQIGHQHWASETWVQFLLRIWNFTTSAQGGGKAYWKFPVVERSSREGF